MKMIKYLILSMLLIGAYFMSSAEAAPAIELYNNSVSGTSLYPHQQVNSNIVFYVYVNESVDYTWYKAGVLISNNFNNYSSQWTGPGQKNITVFGTNVNGSTEHVSWYPLIEQEMAGAGDVITVLNQTPYDSVIDVISSEDPEYESLLFALTMPFTNIFGSIFYVIAFGVPFIFMWIGHGSAKVPAVLACMLSPVLLGAFNPDYIGISVLMILLVLFGVIYSMYKERGT